ncbi:YbaB/EbfC family nucleoid-associated protein [Lentzea albida]|uniref:Conserved DNA-binding protein YbaB n=1 Tax=Lentzea albida TaxID=65499 RepID=A0A1H9MHB3_9PSEU|nr:YbaB/EbfC family nucleoid-associated protein [Lentzea albida]SER23048.1 Conserved DNA-binding protein YbaB [Lentzea albida]
MSDAAARRAELEARNAAMRENVDNLMADLRRRTSEFAGAQARAAAVTGAATSPDGLVQVQVNPAGVLTDLRFAPAAFQRSTPEKLARSVIETAQTAARSAREQVEGVLAPLQGQTDLSELVEGAPSFADLLKPPPPPAAEAPPQRGRPPRQDDPDDDEGFGSVLKGPGQR